MVGVVALEGCQALHQVGGTPGHVQGLQLIQSDLTLICGSGLQALEGAGLLRAVSHPGLTTATDAGVAVETDLGGTPGYEALHE